MTGEGAEEALSAGVASARSPAAEGQRRTGGRCVVVAAAVVAADPAAGAAAAPAAASGARASAGDATSRRLARAEAAQAAAARGAAAAGALVVATAAAAVAGVDARAAFLLLCRRRGKAAGALTEVQGKGIRIEGGDALVVIAVACAAAIAGDVDSRGCVRSSLAPAPTLARSIKATCYQREVAGDTTIKRCWQIKW
jgi:hypothetical protein